MPDDERALPLESGGTEVRRPVDTRRLCVEILARPGLRLVDVPRVLACGVDARNSSFEVDDPLRLPVRIADARQAEHLHYVGAVLRTRLGHLRVVREVVLAIGHSDAALQQVRRI